MDLTDLPSESNFRIGQSFRTRPIAGQASRHVVPMLIVMAKKYAILLLGLAAVGAVVGPMAYYQMLDCGKSTQATAANPQNGLTQSASLEASVAPSEAAAGSQVAASIAAPGTPADRRSSVRVQDASSVFDFQITPEWIVAHWPTVSTGLAQLQLEGYRVPLVTGTAQHDLAGSLTYYFNAQQKLQQITFVGTTGDPRPLIGLLSSRFHLARRLVNDPGLVVYEAVHANNQLASNLQIRLAPLADPNDPYRRYDVELSLQQAVE